MSNFLQLCQLSRQECGLAGDGPTTVDAQTGVMKKVVDRVKRSWIDIQVSGQHWKFLRDQLTFVLTPGQQEYSIDGDLGLTTIDKFDPELAFIFRDSTADENKMRLIDYQSFRVRHRTFPAGRPTAFCEAPGNNIQFNFTPDYAYTITLDYWLTPERLTANTDIPLLPEQFHDLIVWKSVMMFAGNEGAPELFNYAKSMYTPMMMKLTVDQAEVAGITRHFPLAIGRTQRTGF